MPRPSRWNELLQAAAEEFRAVGYENATLEGVSRRVGITKGSLYHYIDTKDELLWAVIDAPARELIERLEELTTARRGPVAVRLRELFRLQVRIFAEHHPAAFVYLAQIGRPDQPEAIAQLERRYVAAVESLVAEGAERGEFALATSPAVAARAVIGMLDWMMHWYDPDGTTPPEVLADELFAIAVGGLVTGAQISALLPDHLEDPEPADGDTTDAP
ncbi:TetR/AcrR family transcriptional regulator [Nitriliruptoraceae bacterium ZYF776]|nr:TetR/AcrR family transcriptional regulator [Profundirhabdus halotolerans]